MTYTRKIVRSTGPVNARLVVVGESPADREVAKGEPFVGPAGGYLNLALAKSALNRKGIYIMNLVPVQPFGNKFDNHDSETLKWGLERFEQELAALNPDLVVACGGNALRYLTGIRHGILDWRGSLLHPEHWPCVDFLDERGEFVAPAYAGIIKRPWPVLATLHPSYILQSRDFKQLWWLRQDFQAAAKYLRGEWSFEYEHRTWHINPSPDELWEFACNVVGPRYVPNPHPQTVEKPSAIGTPPGHVLVGGRNFVAVDTEGEPFWIVSFADERDVYAFGWDEKYRAATELILGSEHVLKTAHNLEYDWTFFRKMLNIRVSWPWVDTMGVCHILNPEMRKELSPHASTRYTTWPYHEWMQGWNPVVYCGLDTACCADIYWGQVDNWEEAPNSQRNIAFDHKLFEALMEMTERGILVDESARAPLERKYGDELFDAEERIRTMARPIIRSRLVAFEKPHLFFAQKSCGCCHGRLPGAANKSKKTVRCWSCAGFDRAPTKGMMCDGVEMIFFDGEAHDPKKMLKADLEEQTLRPCVECEGQGYNENWKPFNPGSDDQLKDVLYKGVGLYPRRFKGKVTVRYDRLETIKNPPPILTAVISAAKLRAEYKTLQRIKPGLDGRLHSVFTPFVARSFRVASREGLLEVGTNLMNIPYEARRLFVPDPGHFFLYPDMEQIEARYVAMASGCQTLLDIYTEGGDSHTRLMEIIKERTGFDMNAINIGPHAGQGRFFTKKSVYAFMYGIRPKFLSGELGIPEALAAEILLTLKMVLPEIDTWKDSIRQEVYRTRRVSTPDLHSRKFLDRINKKGELDYEIWKRALSHKPQDGAARILAEGMLDIRNNHADLMVPLIHVHDALVLMAQDGPQEHRRKCVDAALSVLSREKWGMQFESGMSVGPNWYVASLSDEDKIKEGYEEWTMENFLAGCGSLISDATKVTL